jgi:UDP-glucose 4-epimerase
MIKKLNENKYKLTGIFKKAIVTGGAGFIGSNLVKSLLEDGLEVISLDDYSVGKRNNLYDMQKKYKKNFQQIHCDITDKKKTEIYFEGVDIVFHQACSKMSICLIDPKRDLEVNATGTFNLLELAKKFNIKKFIHASTGSVYGNAIKFPTDEEHPLNPTSYYGVSKLAGEKYVKVFSHLYNMNASILRYYHVFGPKQDPSQYGGVIGIFCLRALKNLDLTVYGDGSQIRSFTSVKDIVNINKLFAVKGISEKKRGGAEAYNCASGLKVSINEIANKIINFANAKSKINYKNWKIGDIKDFDVSNKKLLKLDFKFEHLEFDKALKETFDWYKANLNSFN